MLLIHRKFNLVFYLKSGLFQVQAAFAGRAIFNIRYFIHNSEMHVPACNFHAVNTLRKVLISRSWVLRNAVFNQRLCFRVQAALLRRSLPHHLQQFRCTLYKSRLCIRFRFNKRDIGLDVQHRRAVQQIAARTPNSHLPVDKFHAFQRQQRQTQMVRPVRAARTAS